MSTIRNLDTIGAAYTTAGITNDKAIDKAREHLANVRTFPTLIGQERAQANADLATAINDLNVEGAMAAGQRISAVSTVDQMLKATDAREDAAAEIQRAMIQHFRTHGRSKLEGKFNEVAESFMSAFNALGGPSRLDIDRSIGNPEAAGHVRTLLTTGTTLRQIREAVDIMARWGVIAKVQGFSGTDRYAIEAEKATRYVASVGYPIRETTLNSIPKWAKDSRLGDARAWVELLATAQPRPDTKVELKLTSITDQESEADKLCRRWEAWATTDPNQPISICWKYTPAQISTAQRTSLENQRARAAARPVGYGA